jgi:hypothetical protein
VGWQRRNGRRAGLERDENLAAPALDPADAAAPLQAASGSSILDSPRGRAATDAPLQAKRLEDLLEAHHDARGDVAVAMRAERRLELVVGREARENARVDRDAACPRGEADDPELGGKGARRAARS